nr:hypothetical protein CFP56_79575 [Quercus suber]
MTMPFMLLLCGRFEPFLCAKPLVRSSPRAAPRAEDRHASRSCPGCPDRPLEDECERTDRKCFSTTWLGGH